MLASLLTSHIRRLRADVDGGKLLPHELVDVYAKLYRRRHTKKEDQTEAARQELIQEAFQALIDKPEVRQELRKAAHLEETPDFQQVAVNLKAVEVLLTRYEDFLEQDEEEAMLLLLG